jgi:hypothetical protein
MGALKLHHYFKIGVSESQNGGIGHVWVLLAYLENWKL